MRGLVFVAALAVCVATFAAQSAVAGPREDQAKLVDCMAGREQAETCIGLVSQPCLEIPGNQTTVGMTDCVMRETTAWDGILNDDYQQLMRSLDPEQKKALRDAQRAWIAYRDKTCGFYFELIRGSIAQNLSAGCLAEETAGRVADLKIYLEWIGQ